MRDPVADMFWLGYVWAAAYFVGILLVLLLFVASQVFGIALVSGRGLVIAAFLVPGIQNPLLLAMPSETGIRMPRRARFILIFASVLVWVVSITLLIAGEIQRASAPTLDIDPLDPSALAKLDAVRNNFARTEQLHGIALWLAMSLALLYLVLMTPRLLQTRRNR